MCVIFSLMRLGRIIAWGPSLCGRPRFSFFDAAFCGLSDAFGVVSGAPAPLLRPVAAPAAFSGSFDASGVFSGAPASCSRVVPALSPNGRFPHGFGRANLGFAGSVPVALSCSQLERLGAKYTCELLPVWVQGGAVDPCPALLGQAERL